ncbi:MAG: alpha/beta fold hydrolase, partial [Chloroflexi bacterium]|nr:alpha/beta fold hydrolase [Chloroflexota bacterium]
TQILGCDTHYYIAGSPDPKGLQNPSGLLPPLVMLHGAVIEAATFLDNIKYLAQDRLIIAPDLPLHGRSSFLSPHRTLEWFNAFIDSMGLDQFDLCAHSTGGGIAARYALQHPQRVRRLILCAPTGFGATFPRIFFMPSLARFTDDVVDYVWGDPNRLTTQQRHDFDLILKEFFSSGRWWWYLSGGFLWMLDLPTTSLRQLHTPTLVLWGERDRLVPLNREAVNLLPNAHLRLFTNAGHVVYMEAREEFDEAVKEFISILRKRSL